MKLTEALRQGVIRRSTKSAWGRGVTAYACELVDGIDQAIEGGWAEEDDLKSPFVLKGLMLNGASSWSEYSWGGCSLIYDKDIAERLCNPTELKRTKGGQYAPNGSEQWLDTQARALTQAARQVHRAAEELFEG